MLRPWSDQAHLTPQHIDQLGQLIDLRSAQPPANPGYPLISRVGDMWPWVSGRDGHGTQLVDKEGSAIAPGSQSSIESRARRVELDHGRGDRNDRRRHDESRDCDDEIEGALADRRSHPANCHTTGVSRPLRFLILTQYFPPEVGAAQIRLLAFAQELKGFGHDVRVVTAMPNYPRGKIFENYRGRRHIRERIEGVDVSRSWIYPSTGRSALKRLLSYWSFAISSISGFSAAAHAASN